MRAQPHDQITSPGAGPLLYCEPHMAAIQHLMPASTDCKHKNNQNEWMVPHELHKDEPQLLEQAAYLLYCRGGG
jgi:hypothetical protein